MDRLTSVLVFAGFGCFALAFLLSGLYPYMITDADEPEASIVDVTRVVSPDFKRLKDAYPVAFSKAFGDKETATMLSGKELASLPESPETTATRAASDQAWEAAYAKAVRKGRDIYIGEGCWHCHSQFVRPVSNEEQRFGPVLDHRHYNNALQRPVMFGTRRVGPDLTHEGGKRSNDWHVAHLWNPRATSPDSVMPAYTWYFRKGWQMRRYVSEDTAEQQGLPLDLSHAVPGVFDTKAEAEAAVAALKANPPLNLEEEVERLFVAEGRGPNEEGLSLIAYLQWLGTWDPESRKEAQ